MKPSGVGKIILWQGGSLWIGVAGEPTGIHSHHAVQLTLGLDGELHFMQAGGEWLAYRGAVVSSHVEHAFNARDRLIAHVFVEPESVAGQALAQLARGNGIAAIPSAAADALGARLRECFIGGASREALADAAASVIRAMVSGQEPKPSVDPRVLRSLAHISAQLNRTVRLDDIAESVHLSPGRFRHLFVQETGLSFRAYVLWQRMQRAVERIAAGDSLTAAAHASGFSDSAHLSRTFRRMFGIAPASLITG